VDVAGWMLGFTGVSGPQWLYQQGDTARGHGSLVGPMIHSDTPPAIPFSRLKPSDSGFTLVEMLVALAVTSLVAVLAAGALGSGKSALLLTGEVDAVSAFLGGLRHRAAASGQSLHLAVTPLPERLLLTATTLDAEGLATAEVKTYMLDPAIGIVPSLSTLVGAEVIIHPSGEVSMLSEQDDPVLALGLGVASQPAVGQSGSKNVVLITLDTSSAAVSVHRP
jgi:prepilin-type N-terminal cleavage/methylation domain-containing protein